MKEGLSFDSKSQLRRALLAASFALEHHIEELSRLGGTSIHILIKHRKEQKAEVDAACAMLNKIETVFLD